MQDNLDDMAKAFESKERHVTFTQQKLADSINHHEERIATLEQDISQCTQHVQSLQVKVSKLFTSAHILILYLLDACLCKK